jgi:D-tyrosyl-tRNA(Tyr) deacylase
MNLSLLETSGDILIVSQFTLLADCRKGRRPSFISAEEPEEAKKLYDYFVSMAGEKIDHVGTGEFQAMMKIESVNDGPVTMLLDSRKTF